METGLSAATVANRDDERSDAQLLAAVRAGDESAYAVLWTRHASAARSLARSIGRSRDADDLVSESFYRVLRAINGGGGPDESFRPYLLSTLRRVSIDDGRTYHQRVGLRDEFHDTDFEAGPNAGDLVEQHEEASAAWRAWQSLPESTRTLLWHLIIEEDTPAQLAPILGASPNAVATRGKRARERLRQAFLQQHIRGADNPECASVRERLGAYMRDALGDADRRAVDEHLVGCVGCTTAAAEVRDVNRTLRGAIAPAVLGGPVAAHRYLRSARWTGHRGLPRFSRLARILAVLAVVGCIAGVAVAAFGADGPRRSVAGPRPITPSRSTSSSAAPPAPGTSVAPPSRPAISRTPATKPSSRPAPVAVHPPTLTLPPAPSSSASPSPSIPPSAPPVTGGTVTKTVNASLTGMDSSNATLEFSVPSGWIIDYVSGPTDTSCTGPIGTTRQCTITNPTAGPHTYSVTVTGTSGATGTLTLVYQSSAGTHLQRSYAF